MKCGKTGSPRPAITSLDEVDRERKHDGRAPLAGNVEQRSEIAQLHRLRHRRQDAGGIEQLLRRLLLTSALMILARRVRSASAWRTIVRIILSSISIRRACDTWAFDTWAFNIWIFKARAVEGSGRRPAAGCRTDGTGAATARSIRAWSRPDPRDWRGPALCARRRKSYWRRG
jgi:hypothetical protein